MTENGSPESAQQYFDLGTKAFQNEQYDEVIQHLTKAIELDSTSAEAYISRISRGIAYLVKGEWDRAIADFKQAIQLKPNEATAYNNRGIAYLNKGEWDRAIADFKQAIQLKPNEASAYNNRGIAYAQKGEWDRAIADFKQAIQREPNSAVSYYYRAQVFYSLGAIERSRRDIEQCEKLVQKESKEVFEADIKLLQGKLAIAEKRFPEAIQYLQNASTLAPTKIFITLWLIYARYLQVTQTAQTGIYSKAEPKFKLADDPEYQTELNSLIARLNDLKGWFEKRRVNPSWLKKIGIRLISFVPICFRRLFSDRKDRDRETLKTIYYWLGVFSYQLNDFSHAINHLEAALEVDENFQEAKSLLGNIWNFAYRPTCWRWWFFAPKPLHLWTKRILGGLLVLTALGSLLLPLGEHFFGKQNPLEVMYYIAPALLALLFFFSPVISSLRAGQVEAELISPPPETVLPLSLMESILKKAEQSPLG